VFLALIAARTAHAGCIRAPDLSKTVSEFRANQTSRVDALLQFGQDRNLCFGLEYVTPSLLIDLADLRIHDVTLREAIKLILGEPGLEIRVDKSVIVVTRRVPAAENESLFDYVLPRFAATRASAQEISAALYMQLLLQLNPAITGFAGSHPAGDAEDLVGPISESNRSLRHSLDMIVSESKGGAWIARVPWKTRKDLQVAKRHSPWSVIEYGVRTEYTAILHSLAADLSSHAAADTTIESPPSLQAFFDKVLSSPSSPPSFEDLHRLALQLAHAPSHEIARGLPSLLAALALQDENSKAYACSALFAIARREDGADLLKQYVPAIGHDLLSTNLTNIRAGEIEILGVIKPSPPPEAVSILVEFVRRESPETQSQGAGAIFQLIQIAPDDPRVVETIHEFLSRASLDKGARIATLNALGTPRIEDQRLLRDVTSALDDADQDVRITAIRVVTRMSRTALELAKPTLLRLANDPAQPEQIQNEAKQALGISDAIPQSRLDGPSFTDLPSLFRGLQSPSTTDQAAKQIMNLASSDSRAREYAAKYLPAAIEKNPSAGFKAWQNAVVLAGELKIVEAAPALARWVDIADRGTGGTPLTANLDHFPASTALCRIGNPAIPALETILDNSEPVKRNYAIVTLKMIGSPDSLATLRSHLSYETDPVLRGRIESALRGPQSPPPLGAPEEVFSNSARPEPGDLQRDLAELDSYLSYRNLDTLERVVEEKSRKWQSEDHKSFILYMSKACTLLSSYDIGDMSKRASLLGQYAMRTLASGELPLEDEVQFVEFLMFDPLKIDDASWKKLREQKARLWLSTRRRILESIDPAFDFSDRPFLNVAPPPQSAVPAGISPEAVKDPKLRAEYEAAIARNSAKARRFNKQYWLKRNAPRFYEETERYLVNAYSRPPADSPQLEQLLSEYVEDNTVRSRILKEAAERESQ
jgi:hypothetical protein